MSYARLVQPTESVQGATPREIAALASQCSPDDAGACTARESPGALIDRLSSTCGTTSPKACSTLNDTKLGFDPQGFEAPLDCSDAGGGCSLPPALAACAGPSTACCSAVGIEPMLRPWCEIDDEEELHELTDALQQLDISSQNLREVASLLDEATEAQAERLASTEQADAAAHRGATVAADAEPFSFEPSGEDWGRTARQKCLPFGLPGSLSRRLNDFVAALTWVATACRPPATARRAQGVAAAAASSTAASARQARRRRGWAARARKVC